VATAGALLLAMLAVAVGSATPVQAAFPGANGKIAVDGIVVENLDGSGGVLLHRGAQPSWSADGSRFVFVDPVNRALAVQNADGSGFADLAQGTGCASKTFTHPSFSPDGSRIVFAYGCPGSQSIDVLNLNPFAVRTLLPATATATYTSPAWAPDGSRIALTVVDANNPLGAIEVMNSDGSGLHAVTSGIAGNGYQSPDWSPDGSKLVFIQTVPLKFIVESKADGTSLRLLPNIFHYDFLNPVWSPDGTSLLADNGISNSTPMILMNADGSGQTELPIGSGHPSWQPRAAPKITSAAQATFTVGMRGSFRVTATSKPAPTLRESGALPGGVTFNASMGVLSGTPGRGTTGTYRLTFTASNGVLPDAVQRFTLTVAPRHPPASLAVFPTKGLPGTAVTVRGANFANGEKVTVVYHTGLSAPKPSRVMICAATTTASGAFVCRGKIPATGAGAKGFHSIVATGARGDFSSANFYLT
jgi:Tol biopolymer transport system component